MNMCVFAVDYDSAAAGVVVMVVAVLVARAMGDRLFLKAAQLVSAPSHPLPPWLLMGGRGGREAQETTPGIKNQVRGRFRMDSDLFWIDLARSGWFWFDSACSGLFRLVMACSGLFWLVLASSGWFWIALISAS